MIPISPGQGAINRKWQLAYRPKPRLVLTDSYRTFKDTVAKHASRAVAGRTPFATGELAVAIVEYWPTAHAKQQPKGFARGDVDAPLKAVLDGLQAGGVIDSDARVVELHARKCLDRKNPRILVSIWALTDSSFV